MLRAGTVGSPGYTLAQVSGTIRNVGADVVGSIETKEVRVGGMTFGVDNIGHGILALRGMPVRGIVEIVKAIKVSGSCSTFEAMLLDRWQEGEYVLNQIWASDLVTSKTTEYGEYQYGYGFDYLTAKTMKVIDQYGIGIPYENRVFFGDASKAAKPEEPAIYLKIKPDAGTDNVFDFKVAVYATD